MTKTDVLSTMENELNNLKEQLEVHKEAKRASVTCQDIVEHSEREEDPFSSNYHHANSWHKKEGGGCNIL